MHFASMMRQSSGRLTADRCCPTASFNYNNYAIWCISLKCNKFLRRARKLGVGNQHAHQHISRMCVVTHIDQTPTTVHTPQRFMWDYWLRFFFVFFMSFGAVLFCSSRAIFIFNRRTSAGYLFLPSQILNRCTSYVSHEISGSRVATPRVP